MADSMLTIGSSAIIASQYAIQIASNNIANADTDGYRMRSVGMSESATTTGAGGWNVGNGVTAREAMRSFNTYLEEMYLAKFTGSQKFETQEQWLQGVENVFNQSDGKGVSTLLDDYFKAWSDVAADPSDQAAAEVLIETAATLAETINSMASDLGSQQILMNEELAAGVAQANSLTAKIAELNAAIVSNPDNASLLDERDRMVRELSALVDVDVQYQDNGQVRVSTGSGLPLVDGTNTYELRLENPKAWASLTGESTFEGEIFFEGSSSNEITIEVVNPGTADGGAGAATFKVSYDGGETWLTDDDGQTRLFTADGDDGKVDIDGVEIWFGDQGDPSGVAAGDLATGDTFTVMPKSGLYWYRNSSSFVNVTPLESTGGGDVAGRIDGGKLAGLCAARDACLGTYSQDLDALARALIWETNFAYSQGASATPLSSVLGTYKAEDTAAAMQDGGLEFADQLQSGSFSLALYDEATGDSLGVTAVDFSSIVPPGQATFDPSIHSLEDVAQAINDTFAGQVTASVTDGRLGIQAAAGVEFNFAGDSTGILAACGVNTFFTGTGAGDMAVDSALAADPSLLAAGAVDASGEVQSGDNATALAVAALAETGVDIPRAAGLTTTATLQDFMNDLVAKVGTDTASAEFNADQWTALAQNLDEQQDAASGVNLDEELISLEKYQRMYEASSKIISTSQEMFETLIAML